MSFEESFAKIQAEERGKEDRLIAMQFRKFLVGALCAVCGEALGEPEKEDVPWITQNEDGETMHASCEKEEA